MKAALDTLVASDLPPMAKAFFVTMLALALGVALGAGSALVAYLLRVLPLEREK